MALIQFRQIDGLDSAINTLSGRALTSKTEIENILSGQTQFSNDKFFNGGVDITGTLFINPTGSTRALNLSGNAFNHASYSNYYRESTNRIYSPNSGRLRLQSTAGLGSGTLEFEGSTQSICDFPGLDTSNQDFPINIRTSSTGAFYIQVGSKPLLNLNTQGGFAYVGVANKTPEAPLDISGNIKADGKLGVNTLLGGITDDVVITAAEGAVNNQSKLRLLATQSTTALTTSSGLYLSTVGDGAAMTGYVGTATDSTNGLDLEFIMGDSKLMALRSNYDIELGQSGAFAQPAEVKVFGNVLPSGTGRNLGSATAPWNRVYSNSAIGWHGNEEKITIVPGDFMPQDSVGNLDPKLCYSTTGNAGVRVYDVDLEAICFKTIPQGYKATSFGISGQVIGGGSVSYYKHSINNTFLPGMPDVGSSLNTPTAIPLAAQVEGSWSGMAAISVTFGSTGELVYGGYIGIERV